MHVRDILQSYIDKNHAPSTSGLSTEQLRALILSGNEMQSKVNPENQIVELREYDVPYIMRVSIDRGLLFLSMYLFFP